MQNRNVRATAWLLAAFGLGVLPACLDAGSPAVPWSQIGAKAVADYQGDGLAMSPTAQGARFRCVFQRLEGEATREGLWLTSTDTNAVKERFRVVAVAVGRQAGRAARGASERQSVETLQTLNVVPDAARLADTGTVAIDAQTVRFTRPRAGGGVQREHGWCAAGFCGAGAARRRGRSGRAVGRERR